MSSGAVSLQGVVVKTSDQNTFTKAQLPSTYTRCTWVNFRPRHIPKFYYYFISRIKLISNPSTEAIQIGQTGVIVFIQPAVLSRNSILATDYETAGSAGLTLSSANNDYDVVPYIVKADNSILLGTPQLNFG